MNRERKSVAGIMLAMFLCFAFLAWLFPYTGDDWSWGSSIGIERLSTFFRGYNGRYAGNFTVLALTRSKLLDIIVMAASFSLVCFLSYQYSADRSKASLLLAACLFFLMPKGMWAQVVSWTAGFSNYVPSALIIVAYLVSVKEITGMEISAPKATTGYLVGLFLLSFAGALFVESITVFNICFAVAVIFWVFLKVRKVYRTHMAFLLGSVVGACVMFSNSTYDRIAQGEDYYRYVPVGLRDTVYFAVEQAGNILQYIIYDNLLFCVIVTVLLLTLAVLHIKSATGKKWVALPAVVHVCSLLLLWKKDAVYTMLTNRFALQKLMAGFVPIGIALLYVCSILIMVLCLVEKGRRFRMLLPFYCVVVSLAPLMLVSPVGPRCVFIGHFLMIVFTVDLFGYIRKQILPDEKWLSRGIGLVVILQLLFYVHIFYPIHYYDTLRLNYIHQQVAEGKNEVLMCDLPNSDYLWVSTPGNEGWKNKFKLFYKLDEDLQLQVIQYEELEAIIHGDF